jgi:hypothetical protein
MDIDKFVKEALPRDFSGKNFVTLGFESEIHVKSW